MGNDCAGSAHGSIVHNDNRDNIVLIGMPGAGKSTVGVVLAKIMGMDFLDIDLVIQKRCGATLPDIIRANGPEGFIAIENDVMAGIDVHGTVIAPGGSCVYSDEGMRHLASIGHMVYLHISYEGLIRRLGDLTERGVVMRDGNEGDLLALYNERVPLYHAYAELIIDEDDMDITSAARAIAAALSA